MNRRLLAALLALTACTSSIDDGSDGNDDSSAITAGEIVAGDDPYYWANLTFDQHLAALTAAGNPPTDPTTFTADDDPLAQRLQAIATNLETTMRAVTHNTAAPHPIVKLLKTSHTFNAWSSGTFARLGSPVGDAAHPLPDGQFFYFGDAGDQHTVVEPMAGVLDPFTHPDAWARPASFTQVWNMNPATDPTCKLKVVSGRIMPTDPTCMPLGYSSADALVPATSPFLTIASDLVSAFEDEKTMTFVMAHELGHLFRAHTSPLTTRKYGFWYDQGPSSKRPVPSAQAAALATTYQQYERTRVATDTLQNVALPVELRLLPIAAAYFTEAAVMQHPEAAAGLGLSTCDGYNDWQTMYGSPTNLINTVLQSQTADPTVEAAYRALEPIYTGCAAAHFSPGRTEVGGIDNQVLDTALANSLVAAWPVAPMDNETIAAYLARAIPAAQQVEMGAEQFRADMNANHIGYYTIEQEADEVAMELMVRMGYTRQDALNAWVAFGYAIDAKYPPGPELDTGRATTQTCAAWLANGFMLTNADGSKTPVPMTIGDISEPHHGDCYRLYNLYRESQSHVYDSKGAVPPALVPAWSDMLMHAADLTAAAMAAGQ